MATMTRKGSEKARQEKARRAFRKLNETIGCDVEYQRDIRCYFVYGPADVYAYEADEVEPLRRDPCDGYHNACGWDEALGILEAYAADLRFHRLGIDGDDTDAIEAACEADEDGKALLIEWRDGAADDVTVDVGGILADWLEDNGHGRLAGVLRAAITR